MHMNTKTPVVELEDIRLEPFDIGKHLTDRYVSWLNDPTVVRYSEQRHRRHTLDSCGAFARSFSESPNYFWAIIANTTASIHIGNLVAYIDPHNNSLDRPRAEC